MMTQEHLIPLLGESEFEFQTLPLGSLPSALEATPPSAQAKRSKREVTPTLDEPQEVVVIDDDEGVQKTTEAITTMTVPAIWLPTMGISAQHKFPLKVKKPVMPKPPQVHMTSPAAPKATAGGRRASTSAQPTTTSSENASVSPRTPAR